MFQRGWNHQPASVCEQNWLQLCQFLRSRMVYIRYPNFKPYPRPFQPVGWSLYYIITYIHIIYISIYLCTVYIYIHSIYIIFKCISMMISPLYLKKIFTSALAAALTASSQVAPGRHVELRVYFDRAAGRKDDNGVFSKDGYVMLRYIYIYIYYTIYIMYNNSRCMDWWRCVKVSQCKQKTTCTGIDCDISVIWCVANKTLGTQFTRLPSGKLT